MKLPLLILTALILVLTAIWEVRLFSQPAVSMGAPPYDPAFDDIPDISDESWLAAWKRPDGPPRVGLQAGHWKNDELPGELENLRGNTGASGGGKAEWEVNLTIAEETKNLLIPYGIEVDILPATVPPGYFADAFIAIHADGSASPETSGYKAARPRRDSSGKAQLLLEYINDEYGRSTGLPIDPNVTRDMRGYYAFAWWRRRHSVHPMTPAIILETGFLTSPSDRLIIVDHPETAAAGIAGGIRSYLKTTGLLLLR